MRRLISNDDEITYVTDETYKEIETRGLPKLVMFVFTTEGPIGESAIIIPPNDTFHWVRE